MKYLYVICEKMYVININFNMNKPQYVKAIEKLSDEIIQLERDLKFVKSAVAKKFIKKEIKELQTRIDLLTPYYTK